MSIKRILFNTEMVQAILDGRKTVTRRVIKLKYSNTHIEWKNDKYGKILIELQNDVGRETHGRNPDGSTWHKLLAYRYLKAPYTKGDILYVRETWSEWTGGYVYKAWSSPFPQAGAYKSTKWHPSIHMPKEAARIWLKVTDVRVERLKEVTEEQAAKEGAIDNRGFIHSPDNEYDEIHTAREHFEKIWDSTIQKQDLNQYGWDANHWVWVIEFERCKKPQEGENE